MSDSLMNVNLAENAINVIQCEILKSKHVEDAIDFFHECLDAIISDSVQLRKQNAVSFRPDMAQSGEFALKNKQVLSLSANTIPIVKLITFLSNNANYLSSRPLKL